MIGLGSGLYLTTNLGPGPRDGWMTGLHTRFGWPVGRVRLGIEVSVLAVGWLLGGSVGLGTVLFALLIGPSVAQGLAIAGALGTVPGGHCGGHAERVPRTRRLTVRPHVGPILRAVPARRRTRSSSTAWRAARRSLLVCPRIRATQDGAGESVAPSMGPSTPPLDGSASR